MSEKLATAERIDWHRVLFWSSFGLILVYFTFAVANGGQLRLGGILFDKEEQRAASSYLNRNWPDVAKQVGLSNR